MKTMSVEKEEYAMLFARNDEQCGMITYDDANDDVSIRWKKSTNVGNKILLLHTTNGHHKFYECFVYGAKLYYRYGAIGTYGRIGVYTRKSTHELEKLINSKLQAGYYVTTKNPPDFMEATAGGYSLSSVFTKNVVLENKQEKLSKLDLALENSEWDF